MMSDRCYHMSNVFTKLNNHIVRGKKVKKIKYLDIISV